MDGTVEGTKGGDIIDAGYVGDPEGDRIDAGDAVLPGTSPNDDLVEAGAGNDVVTSGEGDDIVSGGVDDDRLDGGAGDDTLDGDAGQDILRGDAGNDALDGGAGDDTLKGGTGEDILTGGEGVDILGGGDDADTIAAGAGDSADGGAGGDDRDTLDLTGLGAYVIEDLIPDSNGNGFDGTVVLLDEDGNPTGETIAFTEIETIVDDRNAAPVAVNDLAEVPEDGTVVISVLDNDSDPDGDPLEVIAASSPDGEVSINPDGTLTFVPAPDFNGPTEISYTITDPSGNTATGTVMVDVTPVDDGPDGTVEGTTGDDLIDVAYMGDPEGDMVDNDDAILPGTSGDDDLILAYDGNDTVLAGEGDDEIYGQDGDDSVLGGTGGDLVYGGNGGDIIDTTDGTPTGPGDFDNPYPPLPEDPVQDDDLDTVYGGSGDEIISTGDDRDTIFGGDGNDSIDAGIDNDEVTAGRGDDTVVGSEGNDLLYGGDGDDVVFGGLDPSFPDALNIPDDAGDRVPDNGLDTIYGGEGNDTIYGEDDDDTIFGGRGNDVVDGGVDDDFINGQGADDAITGGQGDDEIRGGDGTDTLGGEDGDDIILGDAGNDAIAGGAGSDDLSGGDDRDDFTGGNGGDMVDGGGGGDDFDTLDLTGSGVDFITYTSTDREDGIVTFLDGSTMTFQEIENVIPCFTPGTTIATPRGERLVEELREGDRIITRDNGIQEIRWVGRKELTGKNLVGSPHLRPILIRAGALGNGLPERDMLVSPNHRLLVSNEKTQLYFEESEVLAAAKHLVGAEGVHQVDVMQVSYIHFMFDRHEVVLSNGAWTESFQPGDYSLKGLGNSQRNEIFELFPELATRPGLEGYQAARKSLKKHEAKLLVK